MIRPVPLCLASAALLRRLGNSTELAYRNGGLSMKTRLFNYLITPIIQKLRMHPASFCAVGES
jgi:hypothetical protein